MNGIVFVYYKYVKCLIFKTAIYTTHIYFIIKLLHTMKFEVFQNQKDQKYYFRLRNTKGDILMKGQGYSTKRTCMNGIESVRKNCQVAERFDAQVAKNGKHHFNLVARNGQVVAKSTKWEASKQCKTWMSSVKKSAPNAQVQIVNK